MKLAGKVVVITGAANGLGKALAAEFSARDAVIVAIDNDKRGLATLQNELPNITTIEADVTSHLDLQRTLNDTLKIHSQLDIWINNAGIMGPDRPAVKQVMRDIRQVYEVNTFGLIDGSILAAQYFEKHPGGWIINMLSANALGHWPHRSIYSSSKYAGRGFTLALQHELKHTKVLGVFPDGTKTELFGDEVPAEFDEFLEASDVARQVVAAVLAGDTKDLVIKR